MVEEMAEAGEPVFTPRLTLREMQEARRAQREKRRRDHAHE